MGTFERQMIDEKNNKMFGTLPMFYAFFSQIMKYDYTIESVLESFKVMQL